ncbi:MAG TPA: helicase-exonuclease AddAB subunit AddA [Candidatus Dormibacteraeota bacterium]|nr:helicase-exonuclease AddAB subunit AddA [Candidatus Dormibacteraeota bacterium]
MVKWTKEQEDAIYSNGSDILVAAAAGSGKTAVLVERMIQKLLSKENPIDIDSLLVVTFTNAASQEMRNRIGLALESALVDDPTSLHLKKQLSLLPKAHISTLHSFCMDVVRQYAYLLDIDPSFRIANDMETDLIKQDVLDELFEEWYGKEGVDQAHFFDVVDRFSSDRSDLEVENLILTLYTFSMQNPWPEQWLNQLAEVYHIAENWREEELSWLPILKKEVTDQFQAIEEELLLAEQIANESDGPYQYLETVAADKLLLEEALLKLNSWDELQSYMSESKFVTLSRKKMECNEDKRQTFRTLRESYRKRWNDMKNDWFNRNLNGHIEDMREMYGVVKQLTDLVKQFSVLFTQQKKEKAIVDFSDLEHYCLQLFLDESSTIDHIVPSKVAEHFKRQFSEVLVDEYQDTNLVQETIITLVSDQEGSGNIFMVGDVKQSVYGFRHAEPSLFIEKYKRFAESDDQGKRIDLASNFRSREHVLIGANYIFRQIMDEELGGIQYDQDAELIYANKMFEPLPLIESEPELLIIDQEQVEEKKVVSENEEDYQDLEKAQLEARAYAEKIKGWIGQKEAQPLQVVDKTTQVQRDIQYRDIVILLRSMTWAPTIVEELKQQGIPVYAELSTGYFEAIEVRNMLNFLKILDNPMQDIPLAAVLKSPIVGLNEEDLARVRLADKNNHFYGALLKFRQQDMSEAAEKITRFLDVFEELRQDARQGALSDLVWKIFRITGYYDFVGGMPGGRQRQANLRALYDRARSYEETSFRGLFRFLRFIERMEERGDDLGAARALSEQEDVVRIMTIHKSKGLEFPVVMIGGMDRRFNLQDLNKKYLLDKDLGFASKYIDPVKRINYPTLYFHAMQKKKLRDQLAEEIRVLYVALTRAKEKLVMVANVTSFEKKVEKWQKLLDHPKWVLPDYYRVDVRSYLDWVGPALIRHQNNTILHGDAPISEAVLEEIKFDSSQWSISIIHGSELVNLEERSVTEEKQLKDHMIDWKKLELEDTSLDEAVNQRLSYQYPYEEAVRSRAKQTVTEIKRQREIRDAYSSDQLVQSFQAPIIKRPNFIQEEKTITGAEKGTIMHTVMQHLPLTRPLNQTEIIAYIENLVEKEMITNEEAQIVNVATIEHFYQTDIAKRMMDAPTLYREIPFSFSLPASEVYASWNSKQEEQVLIQGVIDCLIPVDGGWILLDYKTDMIMEDITPDLKSKLIQRYETQISLYKQAIESIWKQPVKETYLYFFAKQLLVEVL